jgi:demethoxyubiquinone hydroxylase (CLK1/Coq7/Cat5 family)
VSDYGKRAIRQSSERIEPTINKQTSLSENDLWLLSYYRSSEINGALFFGRVARTLKGGKLQADVTHHFADEANHARYWTDCITDLDATPIKLREAYQDQYLQAIGMPANLMEVMAITQVFEKRVIGQYRQHLRVPGLNPRVRRTIEQIMRDERWHIQYVREALAEMADTYGAGHVDETVDRFSRADQEVYAKALAEYGDRVAFLDPPDAHDPGEIEDAPDPKDSLDIEEPMGVEDPADARDQQAIGGAGGSEP